MSMFILHFHHYSPSYGDGWGDTYDKSDLVIYVNHIFVLRTSMTYLEDGDYYSITKTFYGIFLLSNSMA